MVGAALGVPHSPNCGPWALDSKLPTYSNIMNAPTPQNADDWIDLCHRLGIKAIEFNGTLDYGSYRPRPDIFPNGYEDVRKLVQRFNDAGIVCGLAVGSGVAYRIIRLMEQPFFRLERQVSLTAWAAGVLITVLFAVLVNLAALRPVRNLKLTDLA